jgi:very-short-patch-repair endonuclease
MSPNITCSTCHRPFYKKPSRLKRSGSHYCSRTCTVRGAFVECAFCKKEIWREPNQQQRAKHFCTKECQSNYYDTQKSVKCSGCGKPLWRYKHEQNDAGLYICSNECRSRLGNRYTPVECMVCKKTFEKATADLKRYPNHCCSVECRNKSNNRQQQYQCEQCKKHFVRAPSLTEDRKNLFYSKRCADQSLFKQVNVECLKCKKQFTKSPCYMERTRHSFCSPACFSKHRFDESFVESEFEKLVKPLGVPYERNDRKMLGGLELDFWFPSIRYAVEVNGATHYEPIYGEEVLAAQKSRDRRKHKMCNDRGITLRRVKPGDCKRETYLPRYQAVVREIKKRISDVFR